MDKKAFSERDMYEPVCNFLKEQGFFVKSEVNGYDVVAQKQNHIIVIELKKSFQLKLVYQAIDRQSVCKEVFVAIPRTDKPQNTKQFKNMIKLLKRLNIGLLTVALDSPVKTVDVLLEPVESDIYQNRNKKKKLLLELEGRTGDYNVGGMTRHKIMTAYREKALELCCILQQKDNVSCAFLREIGLSEKHIKMLGTNVYQWYQRVSRGVYCLSCEGKKALEEQEYHKVVEYYRKKWRIMDK